MQQIVNPSFVSGALVFFLYFQGLTTWSASRRQPAGIRVTRWQSMTERLDQRIDDRCLPRKNGPRAIVRRFSMCQRVVMATTHMLNTKSGALPSINHDTAPRDMENGRPTARTTQENSFDTPKW